MRSSLSTNKQRAMAAAMTIIISTIFLGFILSALFKVAFMASQVNSEDIYEMQAKFAAVAAINRAYSELEKNPGWRTGWPAEQALHQNAGIRYKLRVFDSVTQAQLGGYGSGVVAGGADEIYLFAQGFTQAGAGRALAAMGATAYRPGAQIAEVCFAENLLDINGGTSDGFDSRIGDHWYNPGETDPDKKTLLKLAGDVGGNKFVKVAGTVVDGDVILPSPDTFSASGTTHTRLSTTAGQNEIDVSSAIIKGTQQTPTSAREIAEVAIPFDDDTSTAIYDESNFDTLLDSVAVPPAGTPVAKVLPPGAYAEVRVPDGKALELRSGTYYFKDMLSLKDSTVTLNGSGPVKVFIGTELLVTDSNLNPSKVDAMNKNRKPAELQFLFADKKIDISTGEGYSEMKVEGSTINAVMLGATLRAELSDTKFFGGLQAYSLQAQSCDFHYDLALEDLVIGNFSKWKLRGLTTLPKGTTL